jgi:hypothetical protein
MNVKQVLDLPKGYPVDEITVELLSLKKRYVGKSKRPDWDNYSFQDCMVKDDTGEVSLLFKTRDDMTNYLGRIINIKSSLNSNNEIRGMKKDIIKDSTDTQIVVTKGATVTVRDDDMDIEIGYDSVNEDANSYSADTGERQTSSAPTTKTFENKGNTGPSDVGKEIMKQTSLKAAAEVVAHRPDLCDSAIDVIDLAKAYFSWLKGE